MTNILGVHHVAISVPDLQKAREFYVELLGLEEISATEWSAGTDEIDKVVGLKNSAGRQLMLKAKNTYIEVFEYTSPPQAQPLDPKRPVNEYGYTHFGIQVDDARAVFERLTKAGLSFHTEPVHYPSDTGGENTGFRATYGRDFFGNVFEIIEINEGSAIAPL